MRQHPFFCEHDRDPESFFDVLCNFNCRPFAAYDEKNRFTGFLSIHSEAIEDFAFSNPEDLLPALAARMRNCKCETVIAPLYDYQTVRLLESVAESSSIVDCKLIRLLNAQRTLDLTLKLKHSMQPLKNGRVVFDIGGNERLCMQVEDRNAGVFPTDDAPDIRLDAVDAGRFFFSATSAIINNPQVPEGWLPLPLHISRADSF